MPDTSFPEYLLSLVEGKRKAFEALGEPTVKEKPLFTVTDHPFHVRNKVGIQTEFPYRREKKQR